MKLDKRGVSLVEIIVSIALISVVLIFLMTLFVQVRNTYNHGKVESDYEMLKATIIKAIGDDIENYGLSSVDITEINKNKIIFNYNTPRPSNLSQNIRKVLTVYEKKDEGEAEGEYYISYVHEYVHEDAITGDTKVDVLTTEERTETVIRKVPEGSFVEKIIREEENKVVKIKIPIHSEDYTDYSINIYGLIKEGAIS